MPQSGTPAATSLPDAEALCAILIELGTAGLVATTELTGGMGRPQKMGLRLASAAGLTMALRWLVTCAPGVDGCLCRPLRIVE